MLKSMSAVSLLLFAVSSPMSEQPDLAAAHLQTKMWLESSPGQEAVLKVSAESEDDLVGLVVLGPDGNRLAQLDARGSRAAGLSSLELEFRDVDLNTLLAKWVPGTYIVRAATTDGTLATGLAQFDAALPPAPHILAPQNGALVSASDLTVRWTPEPQASGYEVHIEQDDSEGVVIKLPPQQHALQVPVGCLAPDKATFVEVAVLGDDGNCTLTEVQCTTLPN